MNASGPVIVLLERFLTVTTLLNVFVARLRTKPDLVRETWEVRSVKTYVQPFAGTAMPTVSTRDRREKQTVEAPEIVDDLRRRRKGLALHISVSRFERSGNSSAHDKSERG